MSPRGPQRIGAALVAGLILLPPLPSQLPRLFPTAAPTTVVDVTGGLLLPGGSVADLEAAAVTLAEDLAAVPADGQTLCPVEDLMVAWETPRGYLHGTHLEPVGPRPGPATIDINGVVVCTGVNYGYFGFEAHREGLGWRVYPVPTAEVGDINRPATTSELGRPQVALAELPLDALGPIDPYPIYDPQRTCDPTEKAGTVALAALLLDAVPGTGHLGITRDCDLGPTSEHKEGRAFDWAIRPSLRDAADEVLARLLAPDTEGNPHALARRTGVMYIVWDGHIWSSYRAAAGWRPFTGPDPHDDHVHLSLSWDGALGRTSLWQAGMIAGWWDLSQPPAPGPGRTTARTRAPQPEPDPPTVLAAPAPTSTPTTAPDPVPTEPPGLAPDDPATAAGKSFPDDPRQPSTSPSPNPAPTATPAPTPDPPPVPPASSPEEPVAPEEPAEPEPAPPVRILVRFSDLTSEDSRTATMVDADATLVRAIPSVPGLEIWQVPAERATQTVEQLLQSPDVRYAEPDLTITAASTIVDSDVTEQWGLSGEFGIHASTAWAVTSGSRDVVVALLDTGMDFDHPALAPNLWVNSGEIAGNGIDDDGNGYVDDRHGWDFCNDDAVPADDHGLGTHVAGAIGAVRDESAGRSGVAPHVSLAPLKILCADGTGVVSDAVAALDYALGVGSTVSNISGTWTGRASAAFADVLTAAEVAGHLVVAAAGDGATDNDVTPTYPGAYPHDNVVVVAASDSVGGLGASSVWGRASVDLAAPGVAIVSVGSGGGFAVRSGTSQAAAHVTGTAVLLVSANPDRLMSEVRERLLATATRLPHLADRLMTGGVLNAGAAVAGEDDLTRS
jgi:subtilisin family serine protease